MRTSYNWGKSQMLLYTTQNWGNLKIEDGVEENHKCWLIPIYLQLYMYRMQCYDEISSYVCFRPSSTVDFGWFVAFESIKFSMIKLFEIVILWVYYTIPFGFSLFFWHVWDISYQLLKLLVWLRTTDEGSVPEMRIWSILLIKSDLKWCIHLSRSLFLYFNYLMSVTAGGPESPRGHM